MTIDVPAYFARVGYSGEGAPTLDTLRVLHAAHNRSIPFENLDPVLGTPVVDLGADALFAKLVHRRRGGYCYEQNGLFGYVLEALGFGVARLTGRVVWMQEPGAALAAETHNVLAVSIPGHDDRYLCDVGFGGQTLSSPIRLEAGTVQQTRHEPYRLVATGPNALRLEALVRETWQALYVFTTEPRPRIDLEVGSWYVSTYPKSVFVAGLSAALVTDEARWNLRGRQLAVHSNGGTERIELAGAAEVVDQLVHRFGLDLTGLGDVAAGISRVLGS